MSALRSGSQPGPCIKSRPGKLQGDEGRLETPRPLTWAALDVRGSCSSAIGAEGRLGPRLDTLDEDLDENLESIVEPRHDIADGYPSQLMPADFDARLGDAELRALAAFVTAASGGERDGGHGHGHGHGRGRGRGRGRSGGD